MDRVIVHVPTPTWDNIQAAAREHGIPGDAALFIHRRVYDFTLEFQWEWIRDELG